LSIFQMISDRITAFMALHIVLTFETQLRLQQSERHADLLRHAAALAAEGLTAPADELKIHARQLSLADLSVSSPITDAESSRFVTANTDAPVLRPQDPSSRIPHQHTTARPKPRRKAGRK
jgi:hypothetical protein